MFSSFQPYILLASVFVRRTQGLCGENIKWSHKVNIDDVFGLWYGVGYGQHNPDRTNVPNEIGCVSLYITDVNDYQDDWFNWSIQRDNYSSYDWRSSQSNPWPKNDMEGPWLDSRFKRKVKRSGDGEKRVRVLWDEDGNTTGQVYVYYVEEPGLWTAEQLRPVEKELISRGIVSIVKFKNVELIMDFVIRSRTKKVILLSDVWYPDDPPRHPDAIRLIKLTPHMLILNYCSEVGNGGVFSLILQRSPATVNRWEWYQYQKQFYKFDLPDVYRFFAICAACTETSSFVVVLFCFISLVLLW